MLGRLDLQRSGDTVAGGENSAKKAQLAERRQRALSLRKTGASFRAIAATVAKEEDDDGQLKYPGYNESQAFKDVSHSLKELREKTRLDVEEYRELEQERLDTAMLAIARDVQRGDLAAITCWLRISKSRRELLGLDAPLQIQIEERLEAELEQFVSQLESVLPSETFEQVLRAIATVEDRSKAAGKN